MMEFGARLTLKDGMLATMQKNIKAQREFTEQVNRANASVRALGGAKANPTIKAEDRATGIVNSIKNTLSTVNGATATANVDVDERSAKKKVDAILEKIRELKKTAVSPVVRLKETVTSKAEKIKRKLKQIATTYTPIVKVRDLASRGLAKVKNTLGGLGKAIATPIVKIKDMATKAMEPIKATLKGINNMAVKPLIAVKDQASKILGSIGKKLKSLAKGVTIAVGASAGAVVGGALNEGAKLQQSTGGVETLFKGDAGVVVANANKAYKTAGLSANEYMEQVTSFSASLLNSLGGDTAKSAQIADKAMIDMADNANKFGTDISSIQNAYQGFAKQNYTMLDNLKLGYGGTQEEMKRLLSDAQKLTGVKYDISNLADVYTAIHAIQENLGVAGTTSKEASETFSGSFSAMKSSAQNLLGALALGGDIKGSMSALVDTASTFLIGNLVPMVGQIITTLPEAIKTGISQASPKIKEMGKTIIDSLKAGMVSILPSSMRGMVDPLFNSLGSGIGKAVSGIKSLVSGIIPVVATVVTSLAPIVSDIGGMFERLAPVVQGAFEGAFGNAGGLFDTLVKAVQSALPVVETIIGTLATTVGAVMPSILNMFQSLGNVFVAVMPIISNLTTMLGSVIQAVYPVIYNTISMALNAIMPIITAFSGLIQSAMPIVQTIIQTFSNVVGTIFPVVENIFQGLGDKVAQIVGVVTSHMGLLQGIVETVAPIVEGAVTIIASVFSTAWDIIS